MCGLSDASLLASLLLTWVNLPVVATRGHLNSAVGLQGARSCQVGASALPVCRPASQCTWHTSSHNEPLSGLGRVGSTAEHAHCAGRYVPRHRCLCAPVASLARSLLAVSAAHTEKQKDAPDALNGQWASYVRWWVKHELKQRDLAPAWNAELEEAPRHVEREEAIVVGPCAAQGERHAKGAHVSDVTPGVRVRTPL